MCRIAKNEDVTFKILSKPIQQTAPRDSVVESYLREQDGFEES